MLRDGTECGWCGGLCNMGYSTQEGSFQDYLYIRQPLAGVGMGLGCGMGTGCEKFW